MGEFVLAESKDSSFAVHTCQQPWRNANDRMRVNRAVSIKSQYGRVSVQQSGVLKVGDNLEIVDDYHRSLSPQPLRQGFEIINDQIVWRLPELKVGASVNLQSKISTSENGATIHQGGYTTVGLLAQYAITPKVTLAANVNNVTDKRYLSSLFWTQSFYAAPRNASVSLSWKY